MTKIYSSYNFGLAIDRHNRAKLNEPLRRALKLPQNDKIHIAQWVQQDRWYIQFTPPPANIFKHVHILNHTKGDKHNYFKPLIGTNKCKLKVKLIDIDKKLIEILPIDY